MHNILICDDERDIVSALKIYLNNPEYKLFEAYNGLDAIDIVSREDIHLILLDIMMPKMDGITAMSKIRETCNAPIILLTAKSEDTDKILGLNVGADDYITKPFNPLEVAARVNSQLRRYTRLGSDTQKRETYLLGGIELDDAKKTVTVKYNTVTGATGYEIYYSTSKNGVYKRLATTKLTEYTNSKLTSGKTYYFKIRAYKYAANERHCGSFSKKCKVKIL